MTAGQLRELHQRITAIRRRNGEPDDHHYVCQLISDLSSIRFAVVFEACAEL